jgi:hypothetical protein
MSQVEPHKRPRRYSDDLHMNLTAALAAELNEACASADAPRTRANYVREILHLHFMNTSQRYVLRFQRDGVPPVRQLNGTP